jgi:hypothetical protein
MRYSEADALEDERRGRRGIVADFDRSGYP